MESQFESFFNEIIDKDYQEIIQRAEEEATRAERIFYKEKRMNPEAESYAETMKNFLFFMRYNVMPSGVDGRTTTLFDSISDRLSQKSSPHGSPFSFSN